MLEQTNWPLLVNPINRGLVLPNPFKTVNPIKNEELALENSIKPKAIKLIR